MKKKKEKLNWDDVVREANLNDNMRFAEALNYAIGWLHGSGCEHDEYLINLNSLSQKLMKDIHEEIERKNKK